MQQIKGNFRQYIFKSDNSYVVGLFKIKDTSDELKKYKNKVVTFTGYFDELNENDLYVFHGNFVQHERYGEQFQVELFEVVLPEDKDKIIDFLSSNLFPKIGEKKATKIVETLGNDCLELILNNKEVLYKVSGLKDSDIDIIFDNLYKYKNSYQIIVDLTKIGFSFKEAMKIYREYKSNTSLVLKKNPYILVDDIYDLSFIRVDRLRKELGIADWDKNRICAAIIYVINEVNQTLGNTYLSLEEIITYAKRVLGLDNDQLIYTCLEELIDQDRIIKLDDNYVVREMYEAESNIASRLVYLANKNIDTKVSDDEIEWLQDFYDISYNDEQKSAIKNAIINNVLVITGGAGVGKTTIIKGICSLYQNKYDLTNRMLLNEIALLAPTGRASKRMQLETNLPASTIHRFLKWNKEGNTFLVNEDNKSNVRFVIVDEVSMLDTYLFNNLLLGIEPDTKIVLIGDHNQLPSVGPGQILKDLIDSQVIPVIKLEKLYRQKEESNINLLGYQVNNNSVDYNIFNEKEDLLFVNANRINLKEQLKPYLNEYSYLLDDFQILAPIYRGANGIDELNYFIQTIVNPKSHDKNEIIHNGVAFREGDKVLNVVNMPDENIFNGDIGKILSINKGKNKDILIDFDGNEVRFTPSNFSNLKLGYVISIHKSQGSEFNTVIIPILKDYGAMLYKKLIYTAITRAKKKLILIGDIEAFSIATKNNKENIRKTNLKKFLKSCIF